MATIGGRMPSRETALAMIAQVERQAGAISRRAAEDDNILDRFADFRGFIDQLAEFHLFIDMVENRLGGFDPAAREAQIRKLSIIRWAALEIEIEVSSRFLDRMVTGARPWPMGSQKFLRRRLTRLDDIAAFHAVHGAACELTPPNAGLTQNIRDRVAGQIDNSMPLTDFGTAPPADEPVADLAVAEAPVPEPTPVAAALPVADEPASEIPAAAEPATAPPPAPSPPAPASPALPEVMIPGMMSFAPPAPKSLPSDAASPEPSAAKAPVVRPPAAVALPPDLLMPPPAPSPAPAPTPAPKAEPPPPLADQLPPLPADYETEYVSPKAKAVAKLAEKPGAKPAAPGLARRDFQLKVRDDADGYHYIEGNGLAVITEACRLANTTIDELARNLELSRPGLVLILNGRDPCSTELLKVLRRFVLRTGGRV